jgi:serine/threonine protein kinase
MIVISSLTVKPDNIVITGAHQSQDEIWDDDVSRDETEDWSFLRKKWHLTLIDFGFARALTPDDYEKADPRTPVISMEDVSTHSLNRSRHFTRKMSALGNRQYAAPEIINGVQSTSDFSVHQSSCMHPIDVTKTLSSHVSYYGLMADAYSSTFYMNLAMPMVSCH